MMPIIAAGIANMAFVKSPVFKSLHRPIDGGYLCDDGKPLFGSNKTWKGASGMIGFSAAAMLLFFLILGDNISHWTLYDEAAHRYLTPLIYGALMGFAYIVCELPNSFVKRRQNIAPGANIQGLRGVIFTLIDQADSVIGCAIVFLCITPIDLQTAAWIVILGSGIHLIVNILLYCVGLKKQPR